MKERNLLKIAWDIRKDAAIKWACKVPEIHWPSCITLAKDRLTEQINRLTIEQLSENFSKLESKLDYFKKKIAYKFNRALHAQGHNEYSIEDLTQSCSMKLWAALDKNGQPITENTAKTIYKRTLINILNQFNQQKRDNSDIAAVYMYYGADVPEFAQDILEKRFAA